jgi:hypothetical protein
LRYYLETPPLSYDFKIPTYAQNQNTFPEFSPLNCGFEIPAFAKNRDTFPNHRRSVMNFRFHPKTGN